MNSEQFAGDYDYSDVPSQELDAIRIKIAQVTVSLTKVRDDINKPLTVQQWHSLNAKLTLLLTQLNSLTKILKHYEYILDSAIIYPLPNFPTTAHEGLLTTLLRKKKVPEVDEWINDARRNASNSCTRTDLEKDRELSKWYLSVLHEQRSKIISNKNDDNITESFEQKVNEPVIKNIKPKQPFNPNDVLKFIYAGTVMISKDSMKNIEPSKNI
ncbi:RNA polymerase II mediator complex subunit MED8 SCDLUD_002020 [Saccharomycodes ludwigii]|nr:hypothetical protein SCDLUD_002020 [Saccharomycodes ludwigii]KAH3902205.1 hypothetical protein SCDLUD_002020 [Saccharomycodes ludwigii]